MRQIIFCLALFCTIALPLTACGNSESVGDAVKTTARTEDSTVGTLSSAASTDADAEIPPTPAEGSYETIPQERAKAEMDSLTAEGKPFILLDVRRQDEYAESHIEGAILLPNEEIGTERPDALPDLAVPIYVYCRSGNRSLQAAKKLAAMGYTVYDFGGIIDWKYGTV